VNEPDRPPRMPRPRMPITTVRTDVLEIGYHQAGPADGQPVVLLHGFPYDIHSYEEVVPLLVERGLRVIVPYLRGHGPTRFLDPTGPRSGQQAALGTDLLALMDVLEIPAAILAGYDWGGRAACIVAAVWPERCTGLVSVNGYLIQDIAGSRQPIDPTLEAGFWYFWYFATERGRRGLVENRREIARVIWSRNSPAWRFDDEMLDLAAEAFDNDDYVEVVIHGYRHRLGLARGHRSYENLERHLAAQPPITVPTITLDGLADGNFPATDGTPGAVHFTRRRSHRQIPDAGHNLPQEAPRAFADAVLELALRPAT
jgi:pimeloyl-ACP methyl ester carboxylesterase